MSVAKVPRCSPVRPAIANWKMNVSAYSMGVLRLIDPLYSVASQLKTLTAEGMATLKVIAEKITFMSGDWLETNMWCPQTRKLKMAMPREHTRLIENTQLFHRAGSYYFVHAGVRPGVPLEDQRFEDQLWIREPFISSTRDHGAIVVHGHTIAEQVQTAPNRIGLDTGAFRSGILSCLVLEGEEKRLLQTGGAR